MRVSLPTGAWIAVGLVGASLIAPSMSLATATLEQIAGVNGTTVADVTKAHQLMEAPAAPASLFTMETGFNTTATLTCFGLGPLPATKAGVVRDLRYDVLNGSSSDLAVVYTGPSCSNNAVGDFNLAAANGELRFGDGIALPKGGSMSVLLETSGTRDEADIYIDGYTVPAGAVPAAGALVMRGTGLNIANR